MSQLFKRRANSIAKAMLIGVPLLVVGSSAGMWIFARSDFVTQVDVPLEQPVPFSHKHHVYGLGLDCRFCHTTVEKSAFAGMPATEICMTCHSQIWKDAPLLAPVSESFAAPSPDAYETLLWDVMKRDATLFMRADQVEAAWQLLMPVLEAWQETAPSDFPNYAAGTWGPENTQALLAPGHRWPLPTELVAAGKKKGKNS